LRSSRTSFAAPVALCGPYAAGRKGATHRAVQARDGRCGSTALITSQPLRNGPTVRSGSTLNNVCRIWANRTARTTIVASLYCFAVILRELVQRRDGNVARLAIVICVLRRCAPCRRQKIVHVAALPPRNGHRLFQGLLGLRVNSGQGACALA